MYTADGLPALHRSKPQQIGQRANCRNGNWLTYILRPGDHSAEAGATKSSGPPRFHRLEHFLLLPIRRPGHLEPMGRCKEMSSPSKSITSRISTSSEVNCAASTS